MEIFLWSFSHLFFSFSQLQSLMVEGWFEVTFGESVGLLERCSMGEVRRPDS